MAFVFGTLSSNMHILMYRACNTLACNDNAQGTSGIVCVTDRLLLNFRCCDMYHSGVRIPHCLNPLVTNRLSHPYYLDESTFTYRDISSIFCIFILSFDEFFVSKQNNPRSDAVLSMSHNKDTRLKWVKQSSVS